MVNEAVMSLLETTGVSLPIPSMVDRVTANGGTLTEEGRLRFPRALVEDSIAEACRDVVLYGRQPGLELDVSGSRVHFGSGGASPSIVDLETGKYRPSTTRDLYDAARLVDALSNVHLFRSVNGGKRMRRTHTLLMSTRHTPAWPVPSNMFV